jgi:hypothetical protein
VAYPLGFPQGYPQLCVLDAVSNNPLPVHLPVT